MLQAVLFDLDGTLVDTGQLIRVSCDRTFREVLGIAAPAAELTAAVGTPLVEQFERVARGVVCDNDWERPTQALYGRDRLTPLNGAQRAAVDELRDRLITHYTALNDAIHDEYIRAFDGIPKLLETLQSAGKLLGVVTSKRRYAATQDLAHFGLDAYFPVIVCADDLPWHKPDPRPVLHAIELLRQPDPPDAADCAYIGDSPFDMLAGLGAGCMTIGVSWGMFPADQLRACRPDLMVDTPAELADALSAL
ncbi:MAG: HAD-IA family hydrolase [Actinomycetes bacterium]|jgi:pyrophosphatase PpaX|nr:HAD-IA family hydrolase [Actinomycetes bacterium]